MHFPEEVERVRKRVLMDTFTADLSLAAYKRRMENFEKVDIDARGGIGKEPKANGDGAAGAR